MGGELFRAVPQTRRNSGFDINRPLRLPIAPNVLGRQIRINDSRRINHLDFVKARGDFYRKDTGNQKPAFVASLVAYAVDPAAIERNARARRELSRRSQISGVRTIDRAANHV
jgi:hypothetical protein